MGRLFLSEIREQTLDSMYKWPHLPVVFALSQLPTVQNRCQARRPYRGFSCFCRYPRYTAGHAYRGFLRFRHYQRYEIELSPPIPTVGFCIFGVTHGRKSLSGPLTVPWFFAFLLLPTVCRRSHVPWVFAFLPLPTVHRWSRIPWVFAFCLLPTV